MKFIAVLICMGFGILVLAKLYGIDPQDLNSQTIKELFQHAIADMRDAVMDIVEEIKQNIQAMKNR